MLTVVFPTPPLPRKNVSLVSRFGIRRSEHEGHEGTEKVTEYGLSNRTERLLVTATRAHIRCSRCIESPRNATLYKSKRLKTPVSWRLLGDWDIE